MEELTPLERFQVAVQVADNFEYDFFYATDDWKLGFICMCQNEPTDEQKENDEYCEGYWFISLDVSIPFSSCDAEGCQAIAGDFTKYSYFPDCYCDEDYDNDGQYKFQKQVSDLMEKALIDARKVKEDLGYYPIHINGDKEGIPESEFPYEYGVG